MFYVNVDMKHYLTFILFTLTLISGLAQSTVESIPNQKLIDNSYVSNPDKILCETTVGQIDAILSAVEKETTAQVAVVAVNSIGEADIFDFAQQLFDNWGIGKTGTDNGLLILLVEDKHTIRFHTGYGLEGMLPDAICKRIQREYMVPEFKNNNYDGGMLAGIQEVQKILTNPAYAEELREGEKNDSDDIGFIILAIVLGVTILFTFLVKYGFRKFADSKKPAFTPYTEMRLTFREWLIEFALIPALIMTGVGIADLPDSTILCIVSLYVYFMITLFHKVYRMKKVIKRFSDEGNYHEITEFLRSTQSYFLFTAFVFPAPFLFYFFYHLSRKQKFRNHPRKCKICKGTMRKLNETEDDQHLSSAKQMEEKLKSVDYDVWKCEACSATEEYIYRNRWSKYKECPYCKTYASYLVGRHTVVSPTYTSSGRGEEVHNCKFCGKTKTTTYTIAQLTRSSSGSSSSSSGGGSWGGGRSGGGGASSSW